jgi:hypothetical protein
MTRFGKWVASLAVLVVGCNTDTRTDYLHLPTDKIEAELSLTSPELAPFRSDGVVAAPLFRTLTPQSTQVWIKLWSSSLQSVSVRSVVLTGSQDSVSFPAEHTTQTDKAAGKGIQYGLILLGEVRNDKLAAMTQSGPAQLAIDWKVGATSEYRPLRFVISAKTSKHWATH